MGFDPIWDEQCEILILGSFPGVKSRDKKFYYAHPQNRFWQTLKNVYGEDFSEDAKAKTAFLLKNKIALWDVIKLSNAKGSLDSELMRADTSKNAMSEFLVKLPRLKKILCNGRLAYQQLIKLCPAQKEIAQYLPSTSPSNAANKQEQYIQWKNALLD